MVGALRRRSGSCSPSLTDGTFLTPRNLSLLARQMAVTVDPRRRHGAGDRGRPDRPLGGRPGRPPGRGRRPWPSPNHDWPLLAGLRCWRSSLGALLGLRAGQPGGLAAHPALHRHPRRHAGLPGRAARRRPAACPSRPPPVVPATSARPTCPPTLGWVLAGPWSPPVLAGAALARRAAPRAVRWLGLAALALVRHRGDERLRGHPAARAARARAGRRSSSASASTRPSAATCTRSAATARPRSTPASTSSGTSSASSP